MEDDTYNEENWMDILLSLYEPVKRKKPAAKNSGNRLNANQA